MAGAGIISHKAAPGAGFIAAELYVGAFSGISGVAS